MRFGSRKMLSLVLSAAMVLSALPATAIAEEVETASGEESQVILAEGEKADEAVPADETDLPTDATLDEMLDAEAAPDETADDEAPATESDDEGKDAAEATDQPVEESVDDQRTSAQELADEAKGDAGQATEDPIVVQDEKEDVEELVGADFYEGQRNAQDIPLNVDVTGSFEDNTHGRRWFKVSLPSDGVLRLSMLTNIDYYYLFTYDAQGNTVAAESDYSNIPSFSHDYRLTKGTYYVMLAAYSNGNFKLGVDFASDNTSYSEAQGGSNNSIATATTIGANATVRGQFAMNDDADFYKVTLPSAGRLRVRMDTDIKHGHLDIYDSKGESIKLVDHDEATSAAGAPLDLTAGTYYVALNSWDKGTYRLTTKFTSCNESFSEAQGGSNNTIAKASAIKLNTSYKGQMARNDDKDCYKFTLPSAGRATVTCKAQIDVWLAIYDQSGTWMWSEYASKDKQTGVLDYAAKVDLTKGTYYLCVERAGTSQTSGYAFKVGFTSCNESFLEGQGGSNNTMTTASAIKLNTSYKGQLAKNDNKDFYSFTLSSAGRVTVICKARISVGLAIYDQSGEEVWSDRALKDDAGVLDYAKDVNLTEGTYYLCVDEDYSLWETSGYAFRLAFT